MAVKICVCVKIVPREAVQLRFDPELRSLDRAGASEINPSDQYAIEESLLLRNRATAEIVSISMGPADATESLRPGLAMGVDRAVVVADPLLEGSDLVVTARVLAAALAREAPDVIVFGSQSADGGGALLWAAVGECLGLPVLSGVRNLTLADGRVRASRQLADGEQVLEAPMPCVVALSGSVNTPRYPSFRDVVAAKRKEITLLSTADLGLDPESCGWRGARTTVLGLSAPPARQTSGQVVQDEGHAADWLYTFLAERGMA